MDPYEGEVDRRDAMGVATLLVGCAVGLFALKLAGFRFVAGISN